MAVFREDHAGRLGNMRKAFFSEEKNRKTSNSLALFYFAAYPGSFPRAEE
jgi:hypothetical protein